MNYSRQLTALCLGISLTGASGAVFAYPGQELAAQAKIGISDARAIALRAVAGKVTAEELEQEAGGSGLRYSFDIAVGGVTHEVGVDARTGALLESGVEGPHPD